MLCSCYVPEAIYGKNHGSFFLKEFLDEHLEDFQVELAIPGAIISVILAFCRNSEVITGRSFKFRKEILKKMRSCEIADFFSDELLSTICMILLNTPTRQASLDKCTICAKNQLQLIP